MAIERWSPFREMTSMRELMDRLMEETMMTPRRMMEREGWAGMDIYEQNDNYCMEVPLPGVRPEDVNIEVMGSTVTISGEIPCPKPEERERYIAHERPCGKFRRAVTMPMEIDANAAQATFEHGVLRLIMPKAEQARARRIQIGGGRTGRGT